MCVDVFLNPLVNHIKKTYKMSWNKRHFCKKKFNSLYKLENLSNN